MARLAELVGVHARYHAEQHLAGVIISVIHALHKATGGRDYILFASGYLVIGAWLTFGITWRLLGMQWKRKWSRAGQYGSARLPRSTFELIVMFSIAVSLATHGVFLASPPQVLVVLNVSGCAIVLTGFGIAVWGRLNLREFWAPGRAVVRSEHVLIVTGPYRLVRHPIYAGELLMALGTSIWASSWILLIFLFGGLLVYDLNRAQSEERLLSQHFGAAYAQYQATVPMLFPNLLRKRH